MTSKVTACSSAENDRYLLHQTSTTPVFASTAVFIVGWPWGRRPGIGRTLPLPLIARGGWCRCWFWFWFWCWCCAPRIILERRRVDHGPVLLGVAAASAAPGSSGIEPPLGVIPRHYVVERASEVVQEDQIPRQLLVDDASNAAASELSKS